MPKENTYRNLSRRYALAVVCPRLGCRAQQGKMCQRPSGGATDLHSARVDVAETDPHVSEIVRKLREQEGI